MILGVHLSFLPRRSGESNAAASAASTVSSAVISRGRALRRQPASIRRHRSDDTFVQRRNRSQSWVPLSLITHIHLAHRRLFSGHDQRKRVPCVRPPQQPAKDSSERGFLI